jgi:hypothetical protein
MQQTVSPGKKIQKKPDRKSEILDGKTDTATGDVQCGINTDMVGV